jgi:hypothetical protein
MPPDQGLLVMAHYRAYLIGCDGHRIKAVDLNCTDDDDAKNRAPNASAILKHFDRQAKKNFFNERYLCISDILVTEPPLGSTPITNHPIDPCGM